jgi:hypothetical protein
MRIGKKLRDVKNLGTVHLDVWVFEVSRKLYIQTLARVQGTLFWTITAASGTIDKPERVMCLAAGHAENSSQEILISSGPESLLKALKDGTTKAFDHNDQAKQHREKEFGALMKGL